MLIFFFPSTLPSKNSMKLLLVWHILLSHPGFMLNKKGRYSENVVRAKVSLGLVSWMRMCFPGPWWEQTAWTLCGGYLTGFLFLPNMPGPEAPYSLICAPPGSKIETILAYFLASALTLGSNMPCVAIWSLNVHQKPWVYLVYQSVSVTYNNNNNFMSVVGLRKEADA